MQRTLLVIILSTLAVAGVTLAQHGGHGNGGVQVKLLSQKDIIEKLDGKKAKATMLEVTLAPGEVEAAHRHPGPAFGYILEGEYEWAIDDRHDAIRSLAQALRSSGVGLADSCSSTRKHRGDCHDTDLSYTHCAADEPAFLAV